MQGSCRDTMNVNPAGRSIPLPGGRTVTMMLLNLRPSAFLTRGEARAAPQPQTGRRPVIPRSYSSAVQLL
jgi:hypothetical protein